MLLSNIAKFFALCGVLAFQVFNKFALGATTCTNSYTVKSGDYCWLIANNNGVTVNDITTCTNAVGFLGGRKLDNTNCYIYPNDKLCLACSTTAPVPAPSPVANSVSLCDFSAATSGSAASNYCKGIQGTTMNTYLNFNWFSVQSGFLTANPRDNGASFYLVFGGCTDGRSFSSIAVDVMAPSASTSLVVDIGVSQTGCISKSSTIYSAAYSVSQGSTYQTIQVPISIFKNMDLSKMFTMGFTAGTGKELRVKNIRMLGTSAPNPPPTSPPPPSGRFRVAPYYEVVVQGNPSISGMKHVTFAFIIADRSNNASFEGDPLSNYKSIIDNFKASGGKPILSFGGAACCELAFTQTDESALRAAYEQFYTVYGIKIWDFDIEGSIVADSASVDRRNRVLSSLQAQYPDLEIYFTVPISSGGLEWDVLTMLNRIKSAGVRISLVNAMVFDYYTSSSNNNINDSKTALTALRGQLDQIDKNLKIGATLMIGKDDSGKIMTVADTTTLLNWISTNIPTATHIAYWAMHRDKPGTNLDASAGISGFTAGDYLKAFKSFA